ncbi:hypothetical protein Q7P37_009901 [Cladosporium fusiforme]
MKGKQHFQPARTSTVLVSTFTFATNLMQRRTDAVPRSDCWPRQMLHRLGKKGLDNMPHEPVDPSLVPILESALNPGSDKNIPGELHGNDRGAKWFDIGRDVLGRPVFEDYGRYSSLFASASAATAHDGGVFPQLVSFIGVTNAGKSTLIKLLISLAQHRKVENDEGGFPSPVVGNAADEKLRSAGGVYIYKDPATSRDDRPMLFVDCEGFEGGEKVSLDSRLNMRDHAKSSGESATPVRARPIQWATTEGTRQREFLVTKLYPRLLYTFSDCVVFVTRNPKTFQSAVLTRLIDWGVAAMERSINQPNLPHCIVVLNCSDPSLSAEEWDVDQCTRSLLSTVCGAINYVEGVPRCRALADHWEKLGRRISSTEDLILCYYTSFKVIRLPVGSQFNRIEQQTTKLANLIERCCLHSSRVKDRMRMQTDVAELERYMQHGFDHFTTHVDLPFDFVQASLMHNPIPSDFGDHILQICLAVQRLHSSSPDELAGGLRQLTAFVASCILLDCARHRKGRLERLSAPYEAYFERAMLEFLSKYVPCGYTNSDGSRKCALVEERHRTKGHQDKHGIISYGGFEPPFGCEFAVKWKMQLKESLRQSQIDFGYRREAADLASSDEQIAWDLHWIAAGLFFTTRADLRSHFTCLHCLIQPPQHVLPCGHAMCGSCFEASGRREGCWVSVDRCRLHQPDLELDSPVRARTKPPGEGVCVLSLDGGGVRGVVQLETLRALEGALGGHVPVHKFFDLIVGAGTGGLIAALLAKGDRSIDQCLDTFTAVYDVAHAHGDRNGTLARLMEKALTDKRKARTCHLHEALKQVFNAQSKLFGEADKFSTDARVALVSSSGAEEKTVLFANYRRPKSDDTAYSILVSNAPEHEARTWEAVGAAMADKASFLPVVVGGRSHTSSKARQANPATLAASEARKLWSGADDTLICLSLGMGQKVSEETGCELPQQGSRAATTSVFDRFLHRRVGSTGLVRALEEGWETFKSQSKHGQPHARGHGIVRLNPSLDGEGERPCEDEYDSLRPVQSAVRIDLQKPQNREALRRVADRLIASCFYLHIDSSVTTGRAEAIVSASIACRFEGDSEPVRGLGKMLRDRFRDGFEPYFEVRPVASCDRVSHRITATMDMVVQMTDRGVFERPAVRLCVDTRPEASSIQLFFPPDHDGLSLGYPLSGLPRKLGCIQPTAASVHPPLATGETRSGDLVRKVRNLGYPAHIHPSMRSPKSADEGQFSTLSHAPLGQISEIEGDGMDNWTPSPSARSLDLDSDMLGGEVCLLPDGLAPLRQNERYSALLPPPASAPLSSRVRTGSDHRRNVSVAESVTGEIANLYISRPVTRGNIETKELPAINTAAASTLPLSAASNSPRAPSRRHPSCQRLQICKDYLLAGGVKFAKATFLPLAPPLPAPLPSSGVKFAKSVKYAESIFLLSAPQLPALLPISASIC